MCDHDHQDDHDKGLAFDLQTMAGRKSDRRQLLKMLVGAAGMGIVMGCGGGSGDEIVASTGTSSGSSSSNTGGSGTTTTGGSTTTGGTTGGTTDSCAEIPPETEGPYPADGRNGPNTLSTAGIVRSDIRSSFGSFSGTATGVAVAVQITVVDVNNNCAPLPGYAVYLWHCNSVGQYSIYEVTAANYLRGVQETDSNGSVIFTSIFPGCYAGRWPHMHFEVFPSLASATAGANAVKTSQLALPAATCSTVYSQSGYGTSSSNLAAVSLATDNVFSDGYSLQIPEVSGDVTNGYTIALQVGVAG